MTNQTQDKTYMTTTRQKNMAQHMAKKKKKHDKNKKTHDIT